MTCELLCTASTFGSKAGFDTMARMAPVFGSSATTAPCRFPSASQAACCTFGSIVVSIAAPFGFCPVRIAFNWSRNCWFAVPLR